MSVALRTTCSPSLHITLHTESCPLACYNFLKLCRLRLYDCTLVHRIDYGYVVQLGLPDSTVACAGKDGDEGGSVYEIYDTGRLPKGTRFFPKEIAGKHRHGRGAVVMTPRSSSGSSAATASTVCSAVHGSQFYIVLSAEPLRHLDSTATVFGFVHNQDALDAFADVLVDEFSKKPLLRKEYIETIDVLKDPFPNELPNRRSIPAVSHRAQAIVEPLKELEKPGKKNEEDSQDRCTLYVSKLNPITSADDLRDLFGSFGTVRSLRLLGRPGTAFVEFNTRLGCEAAKRKMDGAVIDDHLIQIDYRRSFSASSYDQSGLDRPYRSHRRPSDRSP